MTENMDQRQLAAERLAWLGVLQFQRQRRDMADVQAWRDPRQGQGRVLALLKMKPEMTQRELTFLMGMSRQSLAELLSKLEKQGLIEREPSAEDKRTVTVRLTEAGQAADQGGDTYGQPAEDQLDCLDDDEVAHLADYLGRIIERCEQQFGDDFGERRAMLERFWAERGDDPREQRELLEHLRAGRGGGPHMRGGDPRPRSGDPRLRDGDSRLRGGDPHPRGGLPGFPGFPGYAGQPERGFGPYSTQEI